MSIDPDKIITTFSDCRGTCKTPVGCTCGKMESEEEVEPVQKEQKIVAIATTIVEEKKVSYLQKKTDTKVRLCSCGRSENGYCGCSAKKGTNGSVSCCSGTNKLEVHNWMLDLPDLMTESNLVEVQFKNTRKGYYTNSTDLELFKGDVVAVEASPGHDIGEVTLTGKLVELQMKKVNYRGEVRRVYRIAKPADLEKYDQVKAKEHKVMLRAREIAEELKLDMKISDVEFQGDGNKSIFYYIADGRVDFRQLIKHYASEFRVKIEMKQIGARQEAGRVGGIGPCGRELCCSSSMSNFVSVSTSAARLQDIPLNPQKLAGQCGKLKCCLNFEVDTYVEAQKKLPGRDIVLETKDSAYFHFKTDILSGMMTYSSDKHFAANLVTLPRDRVFDIIRQNRKGERPLTLIDHALSAAPEESKSHDVLEQESITRFDERDRRGNDNKRNKRRGKGPRQEAVAQNGQQADRDRSANNNREPKRNSNNNTNRKKVVKVQQEGSTPNAEILREQQSQESSNKRNNNRQRQNRNRQNQQNRTPRNDQKNDD